jgi:predicted RNA binding protein YcfA (HicA-like mRNA interferase family)
VPKLARMSGEQAIRAFERLGFVRVRQRGSHVILRKETPEGPIGCVLPLHRVVAVGTLRSALRQARVPVDEFMSFL